MNLRCVPYIFRPELLPHIGIAPCSDILQIKGQTEIDITCNVAVVYQYIPHMNIIVNESGTLIYYHAFQQMAEKPFIIHGNTLQIERPFNQLFAGDGHNKKRKRRAFAGIIENTTALRLGVCSRVAGLTARRGKREILRGEWQRHNRLADTELVIDTIFIRC